MTRAGWTEAKYPGDSVRVTYLEWPSTGEIGVVSVQAYDMKPAEMKYRVACFCPGRSEQVAGDTPKMVPECEFWTDNAEQADAWFDLYVKREQEDGWRLRNL